MQKQREVGGIRHVTPSRASEAAEREKRMLMSWRVQAAPPQFKNERNALGNARNFKKLNESNFGTPVDLRQLLRKDSNSNEMDFSGPYDFRQLLRPAKHLPTESLRKRKGVIPSESQTQIDTPR